MNRRGFLKSLVGIAIASTIPATAFPELTPVSSIDTIKLIEPKLFINVLDYSAVTDLDHTAMFQRAIDKAAWIGSPAVVYVPNGTYYFNETKTIHQGTRFDSRINTPENIGFAPSMLSQKGVLILQAGNYY